VAFFVPTFRGRTTAAFRELKHKPTKQKKMKTKSKVKCHECGADNLLRYPGGTTRCFTCESESTQAEDNPVARSHEPDGVDVGRGTMSPQLGEVLTNQVVPRLRHAARTIPKVGCEDDEEIVQDATLMAARMMISAETAGQFPRPSSRRFPRSLKRCRMDSKTPWSRQPRMRLRQ
jgi:hypothetical protein